MQSRIYQVEPSSFITTLSSHLKNNNLLTLPPNIDIVKSCSGKQNAPLNPDWLYVRAASVYRHFLTAQIKNERITITRLASVYGCKKDRGSRPGKKVRAGRTHLRSILRDFGRLGWIVEDERGKTVSEDGVRLSEQLIEKILS
ncbi:40S ribosomal protein S19 [Trachipleistophora hominis]|uniref:40S ribosomal protein S19 n=1 Tax=Trachipleistophora hominis TaxID=72359 RepID=L7JRT0_TRAHO|nr:40S ribosomal protein S19 [Trachipleistophora hominis]